MLVLQRKAGESVVIGDNIKVVVVEVRGQRARLGFECPDDVGILRSELPKRIGDRCSNPIDENNQRQRTRTSSEHSEVVQAAERNGRRASVGSGL